VTPPFELDHLFVTVPPEAPGIGPLSALGLREGTRNVHSGQGTANRRIFFHNAMLEFLWLTDAAEAQSAVIRRTRLFERCNPEEMHACPFGICLRPTAHPTDLPFATWDYTPPYLPPGASIPFATNSELTHEPLIFCLPTAVRPDRYPADRQQPVTHPAGLREITQVVLSMPLTQPPSEALRYLHDTGLVLLREGEGYSMQIEFDGGKQGEERSFAPGLPLVWRW
jgi:hypothetical protein